MWEEKEEEKEENISGEAVRGEEKSGILASEGEHGRGSYSPVVRGGVSLTYGELNVCDS